MNTFAENLLKYKKYGVGFNKVRLYQMDYTCELPVPIEYYITGVADIGYSDKVIIFDIEPAEKAAKPLCVNEVLKELNIHPDFHAEFLYVDYSNERPDYIRLSTDGVATDVDFNTVSFEIKD
jgi:hypothetical protein